MARESKTGATFEDLATAFRHGRFAPLYLFFGEEAFLMDELQALALAHALAPHERDFNFDLFYGPETTAPQVLAQCAAFPMMAARRLVVVREFEKLPENKLFQGYAERPNPHAVVLLLCSGKPNRTHHPYRALCAHGVWAEFEPLKENRLPGWVEGRFRALGIAPESGASQMLAEMAGPDLRALALEVDKLVAFVGGAGRVRRDDVLAAAGHSREQNPFALQSALAAGDVPRALAIAHGLLAQASNATGEAVRIVALLTAYLLKLWRVSGCLQEGMAERDLSRQVGISPYFVKEFVAAQRQYGPEGLARALRTLLAADNALKGGSAHDPATILTLALRRAAAPRRAGGAA
ncbi:MAG: DNA polymerase III subunit delta [Rubricoccaceae bacterium]